MLDGVFSGCLLNKGFWGVQVLTKNVEVLGDQVKVVPAALVTEDVARRGETVNFAAASEDDYWAFRVIPDSEVTEKMEVHKVPTYSLSDIKVHSLILLSL